MHTFGACKRLNNAWFLMVSQVLLLGSPGNLVNVASATYLMAQLKTHGLAMSALP